jgi:hypothetical protein
MLLLFLNGYGSHVLWVNISSSSACFYRTDLIPENYSKERIWNHRITHVFSAMIILKKVCYICFFNAPLVNGAGDLSLSDGILLYPHRIC